MQSALKFRVLLLAVGLIVFGAMAALYMAGTRDPNLSALYLHILTIWGVEVDFKPYLPFLDLHAILASRECHRLGYDIFVENPCDILRRVFLYSPFWLAVAPAAIALEHNNWLGTALALIFICTIAWVSNARSRAQAAIYIIALLSPMCVFAIERANADVIMFLFMVAACVALQYGTVSRALAYSALLLVSLLKFYPIAALGLALYEKKLILTTVVVATLAIWTIFLLIAWHQLEELSQLLFQPISPYGDVFGGANIFFDLQARFARHIPEQAGTIAKVLYALAILISIAVAIAASRILGKIGFSTGAMNLELAIFLGGGLIVVFAFFAYLNLPYRGIFLLAPLPFSMSSWRNAPARSISRRLWGSAIGLIVVLLWIQLVPYHLGKTLGYFRISRIFILMVREPLWWLFIVWLMAMLWLQLSSTPLIGTLLERGRMYFNKTQPSAGVSS
jgi:hypothetical protein